MAETFTPDIDDPAAREPQDSQVSTEKKWFMENGVIFEGTKEAADRYAEHLISEAATKQLSYESQTNVASDRPLLSREALAAKGLTGHLDSEQGLSESEFSALTAGWAAGVAERYESGDVKDSSDAKEQAKLHRGVIDLLDSDTSTGRNIDQYITNLQAKVESYRDHRWPSAAIEWKLKVALKTKDMLTDQKDAFEDRVKDIANGEAWVSADTNGDMDMARKHAADEFAAQHNEALTKRRENAPRRKEEVIQNARANAAMSDVDDIFEAARRVTDIAAEAEAPKSPKEAAAMIDASPDLMLQLLAESEVYAEEQKRKTQDSKVHERIEKESARLGKIADSFRELAKLWQNEGSGKSYQQFHEELSDQDIADKTLLGLLADADPALLNNNSLFANSKLAMAKRMSRART